MEKHILRNSQYLSEDDIDDFYEVFLIFDDVINLRKLMDLILSLFLILLFVLF